MDRGIKQLMIAVESYPQINSTENFKTLQAQLEGTENQVKTERDYYNEAVKEFNSYVRGFWKHKALGLVGNDDEEFKVRKMFEADAGSENAPKVSFE
jgi:LemA protein